MTDKNTNDDDAADLARLYRLEAAAMRMVLGLYRANEAAEAVEGVPVTEVMVRHDEDVEDIEQVTALMPVEDLRIVAFELAEAFSEAWANLNPDGHVQWVEGRIAFLLDRAENPLEGLA
ncbi:MAG: hypothetical protein QOG19_2861 [Mycobacterium sp.]|nr:hypothetical protein [Mycobacterium sp.]